MRVGMGVCIYKTFVCIFFAFAGAHAFVLPLIHIHCGKMQSNYFDVSINVVFLGADSGAKAEQRQQ